MPAQPEVDGQSLGRRVPRVEDRPLIIGEGRYVDDLELAGVTHVAFLRSGVAHARIARLDLSAAEAARGVIAVIDARRLGLGPIQVPIENAAAWSPPRPLLAEDRVRFVGEPVAVVVAESPYAAEDAVELIDVEYEELPVLTDPAAAIADDAVRLHEHSSNVLYDFSFQAGDPERAFADAAVVVEREFDNPRYSAMPIEPRGVAAAPDGDGVRIWSSTQVPHSLRELAASLLGLPPERVRVTCPDVGGGFGLKAHAYPEEVLVAWLARRLGRRVKWIEDRAENLTAASHARDQRVRVRAAAAKDGRLLAIEADVIVDMGAYGVWPHGHLLEPLGTPAMIPGPYRLEHYAARARAVSTNKAPQGAYRGVGLPVAAFVHERLMDVLAGELGIDRAEVRRRNLIPSEELPYTTVSNQRYDSGDYARALDQAIERIGYHSFPEEQAAARAQGRLLGLGLACYVEYTGVNRGVFSGRGMVAIPGHDDARIRIAPDGRLTVWTSLPSVGQGLATTFAQLVGDAVGVGHERVTVAQPDTVLGPAGGTGTFASRSAIAGGGAIADAGGELRRRLLDDAADVLEADAADLDVVGDRVQVAGSPASGVSIADLAAAAPAGRYDVAARFDPPRVSYPYATHACRVEVDARTGHVEIGAYVIVEDCGRVINPGIVEGQAHGATAQGIGGALFEQHAYDANGQLQTASLMDYLVPTAAELPSFALDHLEIPAPDTPNGAKGVGEGGTLAPPGAIANAVADALGQEVNRLPITPERVVAAAAATTPTA